MKDTNSRDVQSAVHAIHTNYEFMLERGYEIVSADEYDVGWQVLLRKQDVFARIIRSRGEEEIYFRQATQPPDEFTAMGSVIYAATGETIPRQESSDLTVIKQYLEKIESYFAGEYVSNKDSLRAAQQAYAAAVSQGRGVGPPEPEAKSILYYPLMGILILLILGGLITLGMVLVDRFF